MVICRTTDCGGEIGAADDRCTTCGTDAGAPNVRAAEEERAALQTRYEAAIETARREGREAALIKFDECAKKTFAVINVELRFLFGFLSSDNQLYGTYQLGVNAETRKAATARNDRHRIGVEGILFGSYGMKIRYAALSLGNGLKSYGNYSIRLREVSVKERASLLEENSYTFVEHHHITPATPGPLGHRSVWSERHKLAVAKLAASITDATSDAEYPGLVLRNGRTRATDDFIEVHIYGPLDNNAIESVTGKSKLKKNPERAIAANVKELVCAAGKVWIEE